MNSRQNQAKKSNQEHILNKYTLKHRIYMVRIEWINPTSMGKENDFYWWWSSVQISVTHTLNEQDHVTSSLKHFNTKNAKAIG